ncbi:hypothetical protein BGAL_0055g00230 [Botrytis galanthina]|uniref:Uncharacterized protein n=1 Tax=Botrytis galanthina TaxID=278940 RepID=A0A4S8RI36_9HELO|nr:hypothetical protein BGAL_0055g00230 [Botrytis galanthina]
MAPEGEGWSLVFVCPLGAPSGIWDAISSTLLPQWIPTILDCGLGLSLGIQNLPTAYLSGVRDWAMNMVGSLCGGDQPTLRHETHILPVRPELLREL